MIRVSKQHPCPVCGRPDWCGIAEDGAVAVCMRVESNQTAKNGGWVHVIGQTRPIARCPAAKPAVKPPLFNATALIKSWTEETSLSALYDHAESLGVSASSLAVLGACRSAKHDAWAFPMRDGKGNIIGIRLRNEQGKKWAVPGSREGLFYPEVKSDETTLVVCEGPTDTAAALTIGLRAIGRPSCLGAVELFQSLTRRLRITHLHIIGDNDTPRKRIGGGWWQPGLEGAMKLAGACRLPFKLIVPPVEALREWVRAGLSSDAFYEIAKQQRWRKYGG